jgi:hypothetical protein
VFHNTNIKFTITLDNANIFSITLYKTNSIMERQAKVVQMAKREAFPQLMNRSLKYMLAKKELTKENCSRELWASIGGDDGPIYLVKN